MNVEDEVSELRQLTSGISDAVRSVYSTITFVQSRLERIEDALKAERREPRASSPCQNDVITDNDSETVISENDEKEDDKVHGNLQNAQRT